MAERKYSAGGGRIAQICARLTPCDTFADVGCDHGYCAQYMLENNLCSRAVISDISPKSLKKAQNLLSVFAAQGRLTSVCCDGLTGIESADLVLIAGMGGEEIVRILKEGYIPHSYVFQPMRDAHILRAFLIENGCAIEEDNIFRDGRYYFIIKGRASGGTAEYSAAELSFGRDSLHNPELRGYLAEEIAKVESYLERDMNSLNRSSLNGRLNFFKGVYSGEIK